MDYDVSFLALCSFNSFIKLSDFTRMFGKVIPIVPWLDMDKLVGFYRQFDEFIQFKFFRRLSNPKFDFEWQTPTSTQNSCLLLTFFFFLKPTKNLLSQLISIKWLNKKRAKIGLQSNTFQFWHDSPALDVFFLYVSHEKNDKKLSAN